MKNILIAMLIVLLACGFPGCNKDVPPDVKVVIDPSLKVSCPALQKLPVGEELTMGELYTKYNALMGEMTQCAINNDCLIEAVERVEGKTKDFIATCPEGKKVLKSDNAD